MLKEQHNFTHPRRRKAMNTNQHSTSHPGVHCGVTNCVYHDGQDTCHAKEIHVATQHQDTITEGETFCGTFSPK